MCLYYKKEKSVIHIPQMEIVSKSKSRHFSASVVGALVKCVMR